MSLQSYLTFLRKRSSQQDELSLRHATQSKNLRSLKIVLFALALGLVSWMSYNEFASWAVWPLSVVLLGSIITLVVIERQVRKSKRLAQLNELDPHAELSSDQRLPILYLRSFTDDQTALSLTDDIESFEEELVAALKIAGPVIGVGNPGSDGPAPGAIKLYFKNDEWRQRVIELMDLSRLVVLSAGNSPNFVWELKTSLDRLAPEKILISLAHWRFFGAGKSRGKHLSEFASLINDRLRLPRESLKDVVFIHFEKDWTPKLMKKSNWKELKFSIFGKGTPPSSYDKVIRGYLLPVLRSKGFTNLN